MAKSIIDIKNNKIILNRSLEQDTDIFNDISLDSSIKVISIIGKARTGKSTFLNCIISYFMNDSQTIFETSNTGKNCTNGVDFYYIKEKHIIILDFQGIWVENSSNDSKLLLLAYLMSDIIIFNEKNILTNGTLAQFEPMLAFLNDIKTKEEIKNPKLIFRVGDVSLNIEPTANMRQMLNPEEDQFKAIRECIGDLFDDPYAIHTYVLDRKEIENMNNGNFEEILKCDENGFKNAIIKIEEYIDFCTGTNTLSTFFSNIFTTVKNINNNNKIDFKKLDVVLNLSKNEIGEWIGKLDKNIYSPIKVDGTTECYQNVSKRQSDLKSIIKNIDKEFKSIPKTIRDEKITQLKFDVDKVINESISENKLKAIELFNKIFIKYIPPQYSLSIKFDNLNTLNYDEWIKPLITRLDSIKTESSHIHISVFSIFLKWKAEVIKTIETKYNEEYKKHKTICNYYDDKAKALVKDMETNYESHIKDLVYSTPVVYPYNYIVDKLETKFSTLLNELLRTDYEISDPKYHTIHTIIPEITFSQLQINFTLPATNITNCIQCNDSNKNIKDMNSNFKSIYDKYFTCIQTILKNTISKDLIVKYRTNFLTDYCLNNPMGNLYEYKEKFSKEDLNEYNSYLINEFRKIPNNRTVYQSKPSIDIINDIIVRNPDTKFVLFNYSKYYNQHYMTKEYYVKTLEQVLLRTCKICCEKKYSFNDTENIFSGWLKYIKSLTSEKDNIITINLDNEFSLKTKILHEIFLWEFKKELCRNDVKEYINVDEYIEKYSKK